MLFESHTALLLVFNLQDVRRLAILDAHEVSLLEVGEIGRASDFLSTSLCLGCNRNLSL